jgi:hypothetical protein
LAYTVYPSLQLAIQNTPYNEFLGNEDIAQIETGMGLLSPMNWKLRAQAALELVTSAKANPREK